jgi:predicted methyltransferase
MKLTKWTMAACVLGGLFAVTANAQDEQETRMRATLAAPERAAENKARDDARKPIETIQFVGIETGDTVIDVAAGGGWFTEVLSAAVGPAGKVYAQNLRGNAERMTQLGNVEAVQGDLPGEIRNADAALTALNLHDAYNRGEEGAVQFARNVFAALKPGGVFGVIDHAGIAGQDNAQLHRMQLSQARDVLMKAGFTIEGTSDVLANPEDDHTKSVRDASLERHTDQFLIKARKPQ